MGESATTWLTPGEYAERMGLSEQGVRAMCRNGEIRAEKIGSAWRIPYIDPFTEEIERAEQVAEAVGDIAAAWSKAADSAIETLELMKAALGGREERKAVCDR